MRLNLEEYAWYQRYRPVTIEQCVLPAQTKAIFKKIVETGNLDMDFLLHGPAGVGKTSIALAMLDEMGLDHLFINGSNEGDIGTLRGKISEYASSVSFDGKRNVVIIDEADNMTAAAQLAFRAMVEQFSSSCSWILTCNYPNRIIEGIRSSRMTEIEFRIPRAEQEEMLKQYIIRSMEMLKKEGVPFEPAAVALLCKNKFPDFRGAINSLQKYAKLGKIDVGVVANIANEDVVKLAKILKAKSFNDMKKWVNENIDIEPTQLSANVYEALIPMVQEACLPDLILIRAEYDYKNAFVANRVLNVEAMLVAMMRAAKFK